MALSSFLTATGPGAVSSANLVGVVASLSELIAISAQAQCAPLLRAPRRGSAPGQHRSNQKSRGMEFAESRPYQSGDDARLLDWRQTARRGRPYTKLFQEEHERPVQLLVDLGPSMRFGTRVAFKSVVAARASALLAWRAVVTGERVGGLVCNGDQISAVRPQGRQHGVLALLAALADASAAAPAQHDAGLAEPLERLTRSLLPGSQVTLISDFATLDDRAERLIGALARSADLRLLQVYDIFEQEAPPPGRYHLSDGQRRLDLDLRSEAARVAYGTAFATRQRALEQLAQHCGASWLPLATHQTPASVLAPALLTHPPLWHGPTSGFAP